MSITSADSTRLNGLDLLRGLEGEDASGNAAGAMVLNGSCSCSYEGELGRITRFEDGRRLIPKKEPNLVEGDFVEDIRGRTSTSSY